MCFRRSSHHSMAVGVEILVAHNPLHGSGREDFPHPALPSGNNAKTHLGIGMANTGRGEPPSNETLHPRPRQAMPLASAPQDTTPQSCNGHPKDIEAPAVHRNPVVAYMPEDNRTQIDVLLRDRLMRASPQFGFHFLELRLPPLAHRLTQHRKLPLSRLGTNIHKSQKVERFRLRFPSPSPIGLCKTAKLDEARLIGMQLKPKFRKPLPQFGLEPLRILTMLESHNEVIVVAHDYRIPMHPLLPPLPDPEVKHVVKVEISQERTAIPTLNRPHLATRSLPILQHAGSQPLLMSRTTRRSATRCSINSTSHSRTPMIFSYSQSSCSQSSPCLLSRGSGMNSGWSVRI